MKNDDELRKAVIHDLRREKTLIGKCQVNEDFTFRQVNEVLCRYFQCTPAQLIGKTFTDITPEPDKTIDTDNALMVIRGQRDHYQFPKQYKLPWMEAVVYAVIDVLGIRDEGAAFLYFDVEILEISKAEYMRLRKVALKQKYGKLQRLLRSTGKLSISELKGMVAWAALFFLTIRYAKEAAQLSLAEWLDRLLPLP